MTNQKYKNREYSVTIELVQNPATGVVDIGTRATGSVSVVNCPFILKRISHQIVGDNQVGGIVPPTAQDGHYLVEWRTDQYNYQNEPVASIAAFGSPFDLKDLPTPEEIPEKTAFSVAVTNGIVRADTIQVQVVFIGVEPLYPEARG